jgi:nucleoside 2-deoxyribosyltransferase
MIRSLVLMPFASEFDSVFAAAKAAAASALPGEQIDCSWLKDTLAAGRITDDILHGINDSTFCIADLSGNNANVMWETGYAMALGKPTILIGQSIDTLPFDLKVHRVLSYDLGDLDALTDQLSKAIQETLARYELHTKVDKALRPFSHSTTIAVTGSMNAEPAKLKRRIETVLPRYLTTDVEWLCGSNGLTDESVLDYLATHGQRPKAVLYNRYDLSPSIRRMVDDNRIDAVDASIESLPKGLQGPSEREVLFASRADLVIVFWDGKSRGTKLLIDYFTDNGTNILIGFI